MKQPSLSIAIDERQDVLDEHVVRSIYCAVEVPSETDIKDISSQIETFAQRNHITDLGKLHFTSMSPSQRLSFANLIGKMNITAKAYVYYDFRKNYAEAKKVNLVQAVRATQYKHRNKHLTFYVEKSDEYKGVIRKDAMTVDHFLSLLPDCYCYVFATRLNKPSNKPTTNSANEKMYQLIRHQLRLHTYLFGGRKIEDSRSNRI